jgi:hypothetical protein
VLRGGWGVPDLPVTTFGRASFGARAPHRIRGSVLTRAFPTRGYHLERFAVDARELEPEPVGDGRGDVDEPRGRELTVRDSRSEQDERLSSAP